MHTDKVVISYKNPHRNLLDIECGLGDVSVEIETCRRISCNVDVFSRHKSVNDPPTNAIGSMPDDENPVVARPAVG